jgi:hypothetical protein
MRPIWFSLLNRTLKAKQLINDYISTIGINPGDRAYPHNGVHSTD